MRPSHPSLTALCLAALTAAAAVPARAAPFAPADVSADARYVLHLDMDAMRPTKLWQVIDDQLAGNEAFGSKMGQFEQGSDMHFPRDLHGVTVYGHVTGDAAAVVVVHAKMNREQFLSALTFAPDYADDTYGKYDVPSWTDDDRRLYAAFHDGSTLLFARSVDNLHAALDVMDGKAPALAATDLLVAPAQVAPDGAPALVYVATVDPATSVPPGPNVSPLLQQVAHACLTLTERAAAPSTRPAPATAPAGLVAAIQVRATANSPEGAQQLVAAAGGLRAVVAFAALSRTAQPGTKLAATVLRSATVTQAGRDVTVDASVPVEQLQQAADQAAAANGDPGDK